MEPAGFFSGGDREASNKVVRAAKTHVFRRREAGSGAALSYCWKTACLLHAQESNRNGGSWGVCTKAGSRTELSGKARIGDSCIPTLKLYSCILRSINIPLNTCSAMAGWHVQPQTGPQKFTILKGNLYSGWIAALKRRIHNWLWFEWYWNRQLHLFTY